MGWDEGQTAQIEGIADDPVGDELQQLKDFYLQRFPEVDVQCLFLDRVVSIVQAAADMRAPTPTAAAAAPPVFRSA